MLLFHPGTGTSVRIQDPSTRELRRAAPRVAMFGITNACNLSCGFCSRDLGAHSRWTVEAAAEALRGLARAGTLEVAFGGGEPFAFRGFAELLTELRATTELALHATTNGTLIDARSWPRYRGRFGQLRLSIYPDNPWRTAASTLSSDGQLWGANVLVDAERLATLPALMAELAARGCHDLSILRYVGPDPRMHLDEPQRRALAAMIVDAPIACRVSVCFGDSLDVPRLFGATDCGAGLDFVSIGSDQRVKSCSFQDRDRPGATADEILRAWRDDQALLSAPSPRQGCARTALPLASPPPAPRFAIWQAFSGNNSGECVMVAKFESPADAREYLAKLLPAFDPDADEWPPEWKALFVEESVASLDVEGSDFAPMPHELVAIGRSVLALGYDAGDPFALLRALAWKEGGYVVPGGVHVHDPLTLLVAVQARDAAEARAIEAAVAPNAYRHGDRVLLARPMTGKQRSSVAVAYAGIAAIIGDRSVAAEICWEPVTPEAMVEVLKRLGDSIALRPRLAVYFWGEDGEAKAKALEQSLDADVTRVGSTLLVEGVARRKRLAVLAYRQGAAVRALDGERVKVSGAIWRLEPGTKRSYAKRWPVPAGPIIARLRAVLPAGTTIEVTEVDEKVGTQIALVTSEPGRALAMVDAYATEEGIDQWLGVADLDPLAFTVRRLLADLIASS